MLSLINASQSMHNQVLSGSDGQNKHEQFSPKKWNKGKLERRLIVLPNLPTHNSQSKTYGNPFLQPGSPVLQVQMRSNQDHRFFCKEKQHSLRASICAHLHISISMVWAAPRMHLTISLLWGVSAWMMGYCSNTGLVLVSTSHKASIYFSGMQTCILFSDNSTTS